MQKFSEGEIEIRPDHDRIFVGLRCSIGVVEPNIRLFTCHFSQWTPVALLEWDHFDIFHNSMLSIWSDWKWNSIMLSTALTAKSKKSHILILRIAQAVTQIFSVVVRAAMTVDSGILWLSRVPLKAWPASLQSHLRGRSGTIRALVIALSSCLS